MRPRQVTFAEDCSVILSSSDHGVVYIFDRRSGDVVDELKVGNDRIQAVTVSPDQMFISILLKKA